MQTESHTAVAGGHGVSPEEEPGEISLRLHLGLQQTAGKVLHISCFHLFKLVLGQVRPLVDSLSFLSLLQSFLPSLFFRRISY